MPRLHALLVGVDRYRPSRFANGVPIPSLLGAVNDVRHWHRFLGREPARALLGRVRTLVAPGPGEEPPSDWRAGEPTRGRIVEELRSIVEVAAPGDRVLFQFSGHGARVPTARPDMKGEGAWDECLVPSDAASAGVLRDVEIHALVAEMAARELRALVVLDACHSGGAFRGDSIGAREADREDGRRTLGDLPFLLPGPAVSPAGAAGGPHRSYRNLTSLSGWFPPPEGAALLAACGPHETARELAWEGSISGLLTRHLVDALDELGIEASLGDLHARLSARIRAEVGDQTPVLEGPPELSFDGCSTRWARRVPEAVVIGSGAGAGESIELAVGWFHGIETGARFGSVEVTAARATTSRARLAGGAVSPTSDLVIGARLPLTDIGPRARSWRIATGSEAVGGSAMARLDDVRALLPLSAPVRLELTPAGGRSDFSVVAVSRDSVRVVDGDGLPVRGLPPIPTRSPEAAFTIMRTLEHLALFRRVEALRGLRDGSTLAGRLRLEPFETMEGPGLYGRADRRPVTGPVRAGARLAVELSNQSDEHLFVVVLALQPDWGVVRLHPSLRRGVCETLESRASTVVAAEASLPAGLHEGRDVVLAFASTAPLDLSCHELPPLFGATDEPLEPASDRRRHGTERTWIPEDPRWAVEGFDLDIVAADGGSTVDCRDPGGNLTE